MVDRFIIVTGWSNGSPNNRTGSGYAVRVRTRDRDLYFKRDWKNVIVEFDDRRPSAVVNLPKSFWDNCPELKRSKIGKWMLDKGLAPWEKGRPPRMKLEILGERRFRLTQL